MFYPDDDPTRNNVAWFLMGDFLRFSPWSGKTILLHFVFFLDNSVIPVTP